MKIMLASPLDKGSLGVYCKNALIELGHAVKPFDYREVAYGAGYSTYKQPSIFKRALSKITKPIERMNRELISNAVQYQPGLVFVIKGEIIAPETIQAFNEKAKAKTVLWYPDPSPMLLREAYQDIVKGFAFYDVSFLCDPQHIPEQIRVGVKRAEYLTFGCDPSTHTTLNLTDEEKRFYGSDICFIGSPHGATRIDVLEHLANYDLKIWGRGWERTSLYESHSHLVKLPAYGDELVKVYNASKMAINVNDYPYLIMRNFEAPACGILLLTSELKQLTQYFEVGEEVVTYKDISDLQNKIDYYLEHEEERIKIAKAGQRRALRDHTIKHRMQEMLSIVFV